MQLPRLALGVGLILCGSAFSALSEAPEFPTASERPPPDLVSSARVPSPAAEALLEITRRAQSPEELIALKAAWLNAQTPASVAPPMDADTLRRVRQAAREAAQTPGLDEKTRLRREAGSALLDLTADTPEELVRQKEIFLRDNAEALAYVAEHPAIEPVDLNNEPGVDPKEFTLWKLRQGGSPSEIIAGLEAFQRSRAAKFSKPNDTHP